MGDSLRHFTRRLTFLSSSPLLRRTTGTCAQPHPLATTLELPLPSPPQSTEAGRPSCNNHTGDNALLPQPSRRMQRSG